MIQRLFLPLLLLATLFLSSCMSTRHAIPRDAIFGSPLVQSQPLVIIDPGHGGKDGGTQSLKSPIYQEKTLNLMTAQFLENQLQRLGYRTLLTRTEDTFIPLKERATFANNRDPWIFVSVHYNAAPSTKAEGVEVYFFESDHDRVRTMESRSLAQTVLSEVISQTHAKSRGIKHGNFAVIRETTMPAILVEGGFLTNNSELEKLKQVSYLKHVAVGIAKGIEQYGRGALSR